MKLTIKNNTGNNIKSGDWCLLWRVSQNEEKKQDIENNNAALTELKQTLQGLLQQCETTYFQHEEKRQQVNTNVKNYSSIMQIKYHKNGVYI